MELLHYVGGNTLTGHHMLPNKTAAPEIRYIFLSYWLKGSHRLIWALEAIARAWLPLRLDGKTILLKTPHAYGREHGETKMAVNRKLPPTTLLARVFVCLFVLCVWVSFALILIISFLSSFNLSDACHFQHWPAEGSRSPVNRVEVPSSIVHNHERLLKKKKCVQKIDDKNYHKYVNQW